MFDFETPHLGVVCRLVHPVALPRPQFLLVLEVFDDPRDVVLAVGNEDVFDGVHGMD